jgi:putative oxidoreductase
MTLDFKPLRNPDLGLLLIRVMVGVVGIFHGGQKLFGLFGGDGFRATAAGMEKMGMPMPTISAALVGGAEFFGGVLLILGLYARLAVLPWAFAMFVAVFKVHYPKFGGQGGMEYPLTLAFVLLGLFFTGPGRLALSRATGGAPRARPAAA